MGIGSIIQSGFVKTLSGLGNNSDSIVPMAVKDTISNCAIVDTYKKEGGQDDARERAIEEFGTGAVWLFGIPTLKKAIDKFVYPKFGLNPNLDPRVLKDKQNMDIVQNAIKNNQISAEEKQIFTTLKDKNKILKNFTNEQMYKGMFIGKFAIATGVSAIVLSKLIKYKQKTTQQRIERDFYKNNASTLLVEKKVNSNSVFRGFTGKKNPQAKNNQLSFSGLGNVAELFMYNPIGNTSILDGVITGTRLKEARKGEKKEVGLKEAFQLVFIYGLAKPIQAGFEKMGKMFNLPIGCDPKVIFDKNLKDKLTASENDIKRLLKSNNPKQDFYNLNAKNNPLIELLADNGTISVIKDKKGAIEAKSMLNFVNEKDLKKALNDLSDLSQHTKNISGIKAFKTLAVFGNVALAAWAMGVLQPKVNIFMRKKLHNGDNRNPAIVEQERQMMEKYKKQTQCA